MEVGCRMAAAMLAEEHGCLKTELCLGLPGGGEISEPTTKMTTNLKRGFSETVDLKLKLHHHEESNNIESSTSAGFDVKKENNYLVKSGCVESDKAMVTPKDPTKPPAKAQVVGWPPVRSFRKNMVADHHKSNTSTKDSDKAPPPPVTAAAFVKVSMDGAPYLRKVDLKMYKSYQELSDALAKMFSSFTMGDYGSQGMIDFMNERKLMDVLNSSEYVPTYEDKDGDWMLMGDVPWEMFVDSCKRIRITKGSEAIGLAPRAMEKCKNRW